MFQYFFQHSKSGLITSEQQLTAEMITPNSILHW